MLCGALRPTRGQIFLEGKEVSFHSSHDAMNFGIAMVFQELAMTSGMSVAENIFMNRQPTNKIGLVKKSELYEMAKTYLDLFNIKLDPNVLVKRLSMGQQQLVEILKAVSLDPKVLILDEPTSSLTETETQLLFDLIRKLKEQGVSFIYITHKLSEIFEIADRVMVMRDGQHIITKPVNEVTEKELITKMVGREIKDLYAGNATKVNIGEKYFRVENISSFGLFKNVSFSLKRGEILGFAGLIGAGRTEMATSIIGLHKLSGGHVYLNDEEVKIHSPKDAIDAGIGYISEDRKALGLFLHYSVSDNIIASSLDGFSKYGFMQKSKIKAFSEEQVDKFNIVATSTNQKMMNLSGGNQQKCLLAAWISKDPKVLIFDEPTRGVDVGAKSEIYEKIREYVSKGNGAIVVSSDQPELMGICDRIIIMYRGKICGEINKPQFSEDTIIAHSCGLGDM